MKVGRTCVTNCRARRAKVEYFACEKKLQLKTGRGWAWGWSLLLLIWVGSVVCYGADLWCFGRNGSGGALNFGQTEGRSGKRQSGGRRVSESSVGTVHAGRSVVHGRAGGSGRNS